MGGNKPMCNLFRIYWEIFNQMDNIIILINNMDIIKRYKIEIIYKSDNHKHVSDSDDNVIDVNCIN